MSVKNHISKTDELCWVSFYKFLWVRLQVCIVWTCFDEWYVHDPLRIIDEVLAPPTVPIENRSDLTYKASSCSIQSSYFSVVFVPSSLSEQPCCIPAWIFWTWPWSLECLGTALDSFHPHMGILVRTLNSLSPVLSTLEVYISVA